MKAVVFDHDGTLADTSPQVIAAVNYAFAEVDEPPLPREWHRLIYGPYIASMRRLLPPEKVEAAHRAVFRYEDEHVGDVQYFAGTRELLVDLRNAGIRTGLWTGRCKSGTMVMLLRHDFARFFDLCSFGDDDHHYKPHPDGLRRLVEGFHLSPGEVVMVGDSTHDLAGAVSVGCPMIGVAFTADLRGETLSGTGCRIARSVDDLRALLLGRP